MEYFEDTDTLYIEFRKPQPAMVKKTLVSEGGLEPP